MASMSFISQHPSWVQPGGPQNPFERRNSAADVVTNARFDFAPQSMEERPSFSRRSAPPPLPSFSFPQAPDPVLPTSAPLLSAPNNRENEQGNGENLTVLPPLTAPAVPNAPSLPNPGPGLSARGPGRRGHAHRRSAAISSVDLTAVTKAFPPRPVNNTAPSTPVRLNFGEDSGNLSPRSLHKSTNQTPPLTPRKSEDRPRSSPLPPEPAPESRPLSIVSLAESSTTVRPKNNLSNSGASTPNNEVTNRPKTAGAKFEFGSPSLSGSKEDLTERPRTASAFLALSADSSSVESKQNQPQKPATTRHPLYNSMLSDELPSMPQRAPSSRKCKKSKKTRSWAGILSRKNKKRSAKRPPSRKAPTPPPALSRTNSAMSLSFGVDFDDDNTIVIRTPTDPNRPRRSLPAGLKDDKLSLETSWKPQSFYEQGRDLDIFSPVIDLDAALGPFNTPEMGPERPVSGFSAATKRMYSGGRRGEFVGPEMRYHRRAESAPEMPPFDRAALGLGRYSTAAMLNPDVFDEKEEDEFLAENQIPRPLEPRPALKDESSPAKMTETARKHLSSSTITYEISTNAGGLGIQIVDFADEFLSSNATTPHSVDSFPSPLVAGTPCTPDWDISGLPPPSEIEGSTKDVVEIVEADCWPLPLEPPLTPVTSPPSVTHETPTGPLDSHAILPKPFNLPSRPATVDMALPSPSLSTVSFDPPRLATPVSITEKQASSIYSDKPGSECFPNSVEDVPSLTSSASTMTGTLPRLSGFYHKMAGDRSSSSSALPLPRPASSQTSKRSSLVSLSKLVGVASTERSKLSHEQKAPSDDAEKKTKKKGHRISRLMHFWKSKEKLNETKS